MIETTPTLLKKTIWRPYENKRVHTGNRLTILVTSLSKGSPVWLKGVPRMSHNGHLFGKRVARLGKWATRLGKVVARLLKPATMLQTAPV